MVTFDTLTITSYEYNKDEDSIILTLENKGVKTVVSVGADFGSDVYINNILKITDSNSLDEIVGKTVKCNLSTIGQKIKYLGHLTKPMRMRAYVELKWLPNCQKIKK